VAVARYFGGLLPWAYRDVPWSAEIDGSRLDTYRPVAAGDVQSVATYRYWPGDAAATTYSKTAVWMSSLERQLGWPVVRRILSTYFARAAFRHPTPDEFFAIANEISGRDLTPFFDAVHRSAAVFDYGVAQVTGTGGPRDTVTTVAVRRYGDGISPVDVRVTLRDGSAIDERWDGRERWHLFTYSGPSWDRGVAKVEVDPARVLLFDVNYTNNSWTERPQAAQAATKWALRWLTWAEELVITYGFFA
jgi:hypothetical protein